MPDAVVMPAHAKINLALSVGTPIPQGLPDAGMHPIASWVAAIDLYDDVRYEPRDDGAGIALTRHWAGDAPVRSALHWPEEQDLCCRALVRLGVRVGRELGASIGLTKRIPVGGGLGGGSSDAAAVLAAANRAHALGLSAAELAEVGAPLGSDISFFVDDSAPPSPALVTGLGERIERVRTRPTPIVLCFPPFGCETGRVYRALDEAPVMLDEPAVARLAASGEIDSDSLFNDLSGPAKRTEPQLARIAESIARAVGRPVHLSGSGSTLFVVSETDESAAKLAGSLTLHVPGVVFMPARTQDPSA